MSKRIFAVVVLAALIWLGCTTNAARQETCPKDAPWVKVDDLSGFTYTYDVPEGYYVVENCV